VLASLMALALGGCFLRSDAPEEEPARQQTPATATQSEEPAGAEHVVERGDTLYGIAFRHHLDWRDLAAWNAIAAPYTIYPGRRLRLSASARPGEPRAAPTETRPAAEEPSREAAAETFAAPEAPAIKRSTLETAVRDKPPAAPEKPAPEKSVVEKPAPPPEKPAPPPEREKPVEPPPASTNAAGGVVWRWPASGTITQRFLPGDPARQGMNLQTKPGAAVAAAADGEVVYSGNGLVGYGELIIVKHTGEFLSAYGGSGKRLVAEGAKVKAGAPIAEIGGSGVLHFEIRRAGRPVDPASLLPPR
jgi:lipoprotein NlpD